ncbi:MAG: ABC transporter ATP-binding protein [Deltaproteobacteria bacterium]|nr:MAG: ABC transporter ATP-binding protein [Deltaproteobacteria bacterium]
MGKPDYLGRKIYQIFRLDRAVKFVWKASPGWTLVSLALITIQGALPLLSLYVMKLIIDAVTVSVSISGGSSGFRQVGLLIGLAAGLAVFMILCRSAAAFAQEAQSLTVSDHIYDILHAKSVSMDLAYYENPKYFDTLRRAQQEGPYRPTRIVNGLSQLGKNGISLVAMVGLLFSFHWLVGLILFAAALPGLAVRVIFSGKMYRWQRSRTPDERRAAYYNWILTGDTHAKEVRLFGLGDLFIGRFSQLRKKLRKEKLTLSRHRLVADVIAESIATLAVFSAFGWIAYRTVLGQITLGDMVMFFQAFRHGLGNLRNLLGSLAGLYEDNLFISNFFEFVDLEPAIKKLRNPMAVPKPIKEGITFNDVTFAYPAGEQKVLDGISFSIAPGEVVALVGENGSGKTTLVKLIARLYDPQQGKIAIDGIDLRRFNPLSLRQEISVIFQDYVQYHFTAGENIWLGNIRCHPDHEKIKTAAQRAGVDGVVAGLPKGYDTILGKWFEEGEELSTGQWQKIALARMFFRESQVIILDEPTSSMDAKSEYEIFRKFRRLLDGRSAVLISHRFSTVRMADRILVLEKGRIIENGPHDLLIKNGGKYARLFERQASHYR